MEKFAVIELNNKQYLVRENNLLKVDRVTEPVINVLTVVENDKVNVGNPYLPDYGVELELVEDKKDKKIIVSRYKSKSRYRRNKGHKQPISILKVKSLKKGIKSKVLSLSKAKIETKAGNKETGSKMKVKDQSEPKSSKSKVKE